MAPHRPGLRVAVLSIALLLPCLSATTPADAASPKQRAEALKYAARGRRAVAAKDYGLASELYGEARRLDPSNADFIYAEARVQHLRGHGEQARRLYLKLLVEAPRHRKAAAARAYLAKMRERPGAAGRGPTKKRPAPSKPATPRAKRSPAPLAAEKPHVPALRDGKAGVVWVRLAGGTFSMGSTSGESHEQPVHRVTLPSFELAKTEVTVGQYRACVAAGRCAAPDTGSFCNWGKAGREDHPVNCVDWAQASAFSGWVGGRLPTEAEWEYAARSGGRSWRYPWGSTPGPDCSRIVVGHPGRCTVKEPCGCGRNGTWPVCSKSGGNTAQGLCDMLGNVWEWTSDWYGNYSPGQQRNPTGSTGGSYRVSRGCGWFLTAAGCRAARRSRNSPSYRNNNLGFRPARSIP